MKTITRIHPRRSKTATRRPHRRRPAHRTPAPNASPETRGLWLNSLEEEDFEAPTKEALERAGVENEISELRDSDEELTRESHHRVSDRAWRATEERLF